MSSKRFVKKSSDGLWWNVGKPSGQMILMVGPYLWYCGYTSWRDAVDRAFADAVSVTGDGEKP